MENLKNSKFKVAYLAISMAATGYLGYCQYTGKRLFETFTTNTQKWSPQGQNGFQHK